ncbi:MAG: 5'-nucleotidase C-terminal domain-containing protein [Clostridia bacterium]|nr:5'-nucleotidase C-terminal domain-containing protein [Clostridia bacterium]
MKKLTGPTRVAALILAAILPFAFLHGCTHTITRPKDASALSVLIPTTGRSFDDLVDLLHETHPDITFEKSGYSGANSSAYIFKRFTVGDLTDIILTTYAPTAALQEENMLDLSGYDFIQNYKASVLNNLDINGRVYFLEGPSSIRGICYNKTLFAQMGWEEPTSHEEFTALIKRIREESDILPLALPGKHSGTYFTLMSELSHCDFLQTPDGAAWAQSFAAGEASSKDGFRTGLELLQDWQEAGAFDASQATAGDSENYNMLINRECAMVYMMGKHSLLVELTEAAEDEFGTFPLYGFGDDSAFCATGYGVKIGLHKRLGESGNEQKLENALKLLELFSTEEGQMTSYSGVGDVLTLAGSGSELPALFDGLKTTIAKGHTAPFFYTGYTDIIAVGGAYIKEVCMNGGDMSGVYEVMDDMRRASLDNSEEVYIATVEETLDERQTARFVANALNAQGLGDFALVSMGKYSKYFNEAGGSNGKLYAGGITKADVNIPLSGYNTRNITTITLSGAQVRELLEKGRILKDGEGNLAAFEYIAAGIELERTEDGSIESVRFNGASLEDTARYTVVFSPLDYSDELAKSGELQDTGVVWLETYRNYVVNLGAISPEDAE